MKFIPLRVLALAAIPTLIACASTAPNDSGQNGGAGAKGGSGGTSTGNGGSGAGGSSTNGGSSGSSGGSTGSSGGTTGSNPDATTSGPGCGMGKKAASGTVIENFEGMTQVLEWLVAFKGDVKGKAAVPANGSLTVQVLGPETLALGALASWAAKDRPCMDGSTYTGIQFKLSGNVTDLHFRLGTPATYPLDDGGVCTSATLCAYAHYEKITAVPSATPTEVKVAFSDLKPPYGAPDPFDKSALISLIFLTLDTDTTHTFTIDDISFY
jgi:hypothetical protein